jgi:cysteinyl-tRNA synthetase
VLQQYPAEVIRCFLLSAHYRSEIHYTHDNLKTAEAMLTRLYTTLRGIDCSKIAHDEPFTAAFQDAMNDDFNTPMAWAVLLDCAKQINRLKETDPAQAAHLAGTLKHLLSILGLGQEDPESFLKGHSDNVDEALIESLIQQRVTAKMQKNFKEADRIRDQLSAMHIVLEDSPKGTIWRRERS